MHRIKLRCGAGLGFNVCRVNLLFNPVCLPAPCPVPHTMYPQVGAQAVAKPLTQPEYAQPTQAAQAFNGGKG